MSDCFDANHSCLSAPCWKINKFIKHYKHFIIIIIIINIYIYMNNWFITLTGGVLEEALTRKEDFLEEEKDLEGEEWRGLPPSNCLPVSIDERRAWVAMDSFLFVWWRSEWEKWRVVNEEEHKEKRERNMGLCLRVCGPWAIYWN